MAANRPSVYDNQFFNAGAPAAGFKLYTYESGTTTPKTTYTDQAGTIPNTNPITLDSDGMCELWLGSGEYTLALYTGLIGSGGALVNTWDDVSGAALAGDITTLRADIASTASTAKGAGMVGYSIEQAYPVNTPGEKLNRIPLLTDFPGATADLKFAAAIAEGVPYFRIPHGQHSITSWVVNSGDALVGIVFDPGAQLVVTAALSRIGLHIQKQVFDIYGEMDIISTGTKADGLATVGFQTGDATVGQAYIHIDAIWTENFSGHGALIYEPVYVGIGRAVAQNCTYGIVSLPSSGISGTTFEIGQSYLSGCTRGLYLDSCSWVNITSVIVESCGHATNPDGALHFVGCSNLNITNRYGEANHRNMVKTDSVVTLLNGSMFAATAPDIVSYSGVAFDERGTTQILAKGIYARRLNADTIDNEDLLIGTNMTVPVAGGSVEYGNETRTEESGTLTSATWTTVHTFTSDELNGTNAVKAAFEYACYAGTADLSTGFDFGTIFNNTLRSYSGATPAWLQLSGNTLQMNVTSTTYGLNFKVVLRKVFPG